MTVDQIVKIKKITECTLDLFDLAEGRAMKPYGTYTLMMDKQEKNATVYEIDEKYNGFEVVNYTIKAYIG